MRKKYALSEQKILKILFEQELILVLKYNAIH